MAPVEIFDGQPRGGVKDSAVRRDDNRLAMNAERFSKRSGVDEEVDGVDMNDVAIRYKPQPRWSDGVAPTPEVPDSMDFDGVDP